MKKVEKMEPTTSQYISVEKSDIHNNGVFAKINIPKGTKVIEYVGDKVTKKESDRRADLTLNKNKADENHGMVYLFTLNRWHDLDGDVPWNTAKYINHSCDPNCEVEIDKKDRIWIISIKDIKKGDEINYDYGYDLEDFHKHQCLCGSDNCIGYIISEDHRPKLYKKLDNMGDELSKYKLD